MDPDPYGIGSVFRSFVDPEPHMYIYDKISVSDADPDWIRIQGSSGPGFGIRMQGLKKG